jgi:catechol-2,3-dioxygenase
MIQPMGTKKPHKPKAAIGHVFMKTASVRKTTRFYVALGLRKVFENDGMSIVELRGGTHILFFKNSNRFKKPPKANFDLMVDNVKSFHASLKKSGKKVTRIHHDKRSSHDSFSLKDPDGRVVLIYSSHTEGRRV